MTISIYEFGELSLPINIENKYINATALSKEYFEKTGKLKEPYSWLRLKRTAETLEYVSTITRVSVENLFYVIKGGTNLNEQGTFIHPDLAIPFSSWLSVEFEYKVTKIIQQTLLDASSSNLVNQLDDLWRLVNTMHIYLQSAQGLNRTIHTGIHNQSSQINPALKEIESLIERYRPR
jgi:hypothetical protein